MNHRERYLQLLSPALREPVLHAIREQGYFDLLKVQKARVVDAKPFAYILFDVEANPNFSARGGGLNLTLDGLVDDPPVERYYLPYIGMTPIAAADDLSHELEHLRQLLELIELEPNYPADSLQFGLENIQDAELIPRSVHFEVRKMFILEAPTFGRDFDIGTCTIDMPFFGNTLKYCCKTRHEFVSLWLASYLHSFRELYVKRFPDHAAQIDASFAEATDEYGAEQFGANASKSIEASFSTMSRRALAQFLGLSLD